jgi:hypothetical protein
MFSGSLLSYKAKVQRLDSKLSKRISLKAFEIKFATDEGIKTAAEVELVKAFLTDSNRLLYILVDIGDRSEDKGCREGMPENAE